jgi:predicted phosphodiesterase
MKNRNIKTAIVKSYLEQYVDMPTLTLAKLVYKENKLHFTGVENCRKIIMYYRGKNGIAAREKLVDRVFVEKEYRSFSPYNKTREHKLEVFKLPTSIKDILFLTDIHFPSYNEKALNAALKFGKKEGVDCIYLNGDILDMYQASDHEKRPDHAQIFEEFEMAREFFSYLRQEFPKATIYYKEGNHEQRWERNLMRNAPMLFGNPEFELKTILRLEEYKIHWISNETLVKIGKLNAIHGNEFKGGGGVNPARALYMRAKSNVIAGDKHKSGENTEGSLDGKIVTTWSVGCLCELNPRYLPFAHTIWNHGFARIRINGDNFHVSNYRIYNGEIL